MNPQYEFPFIVLDINVLRDGERMSALVSQCKQNNLGFLLPDAVGFEQSKNIPHAFDTMRRSLTFLAEYPQLVSLARRLSDMKREEVENRKPIASIVEQQATDIFRDILVQLKDGNESKLRDRFTGSAFQNRVQESIDLWSNHDCLRANLRNLGVEIESGVSPELLKRARSSYGDHQTEMVIELLSTQKCLAYGFQNLKRHGFSDTEAISQFQSSSIETRFLLAHFSVAAIWLCRGGLDSAKGSKISNDFTDMEYAILGSVCKQLASNDKKVCAISNVIRSVNENWKSKITSLLGCVQGDRE